MRVTLNGVIPTGTQYLKADGTLTTNANDGAAWLPREVGDVLVQGDVVNSTGTTQVFVEFGYREMPNFPSATPWQNLISVVKSTSKELLSSLNAGARVDGEGPFCRVRIVQATAGSTDSFISVTT